MISSCLYKAHPDFYIEQSHANSPCSTTTFHTHKYYEIYYLSEGCKKYYIHDSIHVVHTGSLVLIDAHVPHKTASMPDTSFTQTTLHFSENFLTQFSPMLSSLALTSIFKEKTFIIPLSFKYKILIESTLSKLLKNKEAVDKEDAPQYSLILNSLFLSELLIYIKEYLDILEEKNTIPYQVMNNKVDKIINYISKHYTENLTLTSIAEEFYISPFYLSKIFKRSTNLSIVEYINSLRIKQAKVLLETSSSRISTIADAVGFSSSSHFSRTFKIATNLSPQQYKKLYHS